MTTGHFKSPIWVFPLVIAVLVALFGWWGNNRLRDTIEEQLKAQLTATLNANVTALEVWMTNQTKLAAFLADEPRVRTLSLTILEKSYQAGFDDKKPPDPQDETALRNYLGPRLQKINYDSAQLVNTNSIIVARRGPFGWGPVSEAHQAKYAELFASREPVVITPYKPEPPPERPGGMRRGGARRFNGLFSNQAAFRGSGTNAGPGGAPPQGPPRGRRGDFTLMQVAAPLRDSANAVQGALALIINPDREFTRILSVARSGESGETYAFDQHGLLISRSRFDDQLRKLGLLDPTNATSALNLRLHDPGAEPVEGVRPLTHIVADAVAGFDGLDVTPSRDYRGVPVIGAWKWLPEQEFGVATQIDANEAFQPLRILKLLFIILCLFLVLCAIGMFLFSYSNVTWRRRLSEAELKLKQLGQYTLEEKIGEGGMGVVYRARHALMRRDTAVKLLLPDRADPESIERFEREVRLTCQLTHPNTIQVYDYGHTPEGIFYYAMEFLRGLNLHELVARFGSQPESRVIHILAQVCDALAEAHALGLVHRDIKPANVFLCNRGGVPDCVKVLDFGLVREFRDGTSARVGDTLASGVEGTPSFMPPEAVKDSARSDPRSDIYSVGALAYYLLTAQYVFNSDSVAALYEKHLSEPPVPPGQRTVNPVSAEMEETILRCLEKEPNLRPQSVGELRAMLLTSPRAAEWTMEARTAWWTHYYSQAAETPAEIVPPAPSPLDATIRIDIATRVK